MNFDIFIASFFASTITSILIIRYSRVFGDFTHDFVDGGPQKFHSHPVPCVGGIGIATGLILAGSLMGLQKGTMPREYGLLLISAISASSKRYGDTMI